MAVELGSCWLCQGSNSQLYVYIYIQDLAKKYISQTFFHLVSTTAILMVIIGDTLTTGVSQAFRWKFAGAKHLRRMEAAPRKKSRWEDLQGTKWRCFT